MVGAMVYPDAEEAPEPTVGYVIWWRGWRLVVRPLPDWVYEAAAYAATVLMWAGLTIFAYVAVALRLHA